MQQNLRAKLKIDGDKTPRFKPFSTGNMSVKCWPPRTLPYLSFGHIFISPAIFTGIPNSMRILTP
jgi:hypothetical protein